MGSHKRAFSPVLESLEGRCVPATIVVKNLNDGGPGSLRQAVLRSNSTPSVTDAVVFRPGLRGTIKLGSQIDITDDVRINGPGAALLRISGQGATRVFNIDDGAGVSSMKARIEKLTLTRGHTPGDGGAIFNENDDVTLRGCTFAGNVADFYGGAYFDNGGALTIVGCRFLGNSANNDSSGGAVYSTGALAVRRAISLSASSVTTTATTA